MTREQLGKLFNSDKLTGIEKKFIMYDYDMETSSFYLALWRCISVADNNNRDLLKLGFPEYVEAFERWRYGNLRELIKDILSETFDVTTTSETYDN